MTLHWTRYSSPVGWLDLVTEGSLLHVLAFPERWEAHRARLEGRRPADSIESADCPGGIRSALDDYFAGDLIALDRIPVEPSGTHFQRSVWAGLRSIRPGHTWTYADLAREVGRPAAVRAVGAANGANPISLVMPCHRVIGSDGDLTGYGGGLERKRWLLEHERRFAQGSRSATEIRPS